MSAPTFRIENSVGDTYVPVDVPNWSLPVDPNSAVYGEIYVENNSTANLLSSAGVWYTCDVGWVPGSYQGVGVHSSPGYYVSPTTAGIYLASVSMSVDVSSLVETYYAAIGHNGLAMRQTRWTQNTSGAWQTVATSAIVSLAAGEPVQVLVKASSVASTSVTLAHAVLRLEKLR